MWSCLTAIICLLPAPTKSLGTSLPGELRLAPHAPGPGWHAVSFTVTIIKFYTGTSELNNASLRTCVG